MRSLICFAVGFGSGVLAAHLLNRDPRGHELLAEVDARINEFADRMGDAYREQEARFSEVVGDVAEAASELTESVRRAATPASDGLDGRSG